MSGETEEHVSGWTTDTLKAHFDDLRRTDGNNIEQRFKAAEERTTLALTAAEAQAVADAVTPRARATSAAIEHLRRHASTAGG